MKTNPMTRILLFSIFSSLLLVACAGDNTPTPTPTTEIGAGSALVELLSQEAYSRLTQQSIDSERVKVGAQMTATQMVVNATATQAQALKDDLATQRAGASTQAAWKVTVEAGKARDAATAKAAIDYATQTAVVQGTATQMAVIGLTATVSAAQTMTPAAATQQAPVAWAKNTAIAAEAESAKLTADRQRMTNDVLAWGPILSFSVLLGAFLFYLWRKSQVGVISDERGNVRVVMINGHALNPDLMFGPVLEFLKSGTRMPALGIPLDMQRQSVRENNIVRGIASMPQGYPAQNGMRLLSGMNAGGVNIQVVQPGQLGAIRDELDERIAQEVTDD
jgi:hypothetical protein